MEAKRHLDEALRLAPNNPEYLSLAGSIERTAGRWEEALAHTQQALRLDPRSVTTATPTAEHLPVAPAVPRGPGASEAVLALAPGDISLIQDKAMVYVAQGDLAGARAVMREVSPDVTAPELVAFFGLYWDMYWVLDESQQQLLLRLTPAAFDNDRSAWATVLMQLYWLRGDRTRARAYADSAWQDTQVQLRAVPGDPQRQVIGALALAYLGRKDEAIALGLQALRLEPDQPGQGERALLSAADGAGLSHGGRTGESARHAGAAAHDAVLPVAGVAQSWIPPSRSSRGIRGMSGCCSRGGIRRGQPGHRQTIRGPHPRSPRGRDPGCRLRVLRVSVVNHLGCWRYFRSRKLINTEDTENNGNARSGSVVLPWCSVFRW